MKKEKEFRYNPQTPCIVRLNGQDVGALIANIFYRFDSNQHADASVLMDSILYQYGKPIGRLQGNSLIMDNSEVLELIEP